MRGRQVSHLIAGTWQALLRAKFSHMYEPIIFEFSTWDLASGRCLRAEETPVSPAMAFVRRRPPGLGIGGRPTAPQAPQPPASFARSGRFLQTVREQANPNG